MFAGLKKLMLKAGWAPLLVLATHNGISMAIGHKPAIDPPMHFSGGAAIAYFFYQAQLIGTNWFGKPKLLMRSVITFCFAATVAVLWEFMEFVSGKLTGHHSQISLDETMEDLILGCSGAFLLLLLIGIIKQFRKQAS